MAATGSTICLLRAGLSTPNLLFIEETKVDVDVRYAAELPETSALLGSGLGEYRCPHRSDSGRLPEEEAVSQVANQRRWYCQTRTGIAPYSVSKK
jgi:hypothetical protein